MSEKNDHMVTDEEIHAYVQYEAGNDEYFKLDDTKASLIKQKIEASDLSRRRYEESKKAYTEIGESLETKGRNRNIYLMVAASAILLLSISYILFTNQNNSQGVGGDNNAIIAANFVVNEELENQVNYPLRSDGQLEATPKKGAILKGAVRFNWQNGADNQYVVTVYNNKGDIMTKKQVTDPPLEIEEEWEAGLYYWSLGNEEENIFWCKFEFYPN